MEVFSIAERWVSNNYPNAPQEEKERLATAFIGGMLEMQRQMKEVDLESNSVMNIEVDDSNISCNSTFCSIHANCKYFNPEKESNVKHCFGGVPMQLKNKKEQSMAPKEMDLDKAANKYADNTANIDARETRYWGFTAGAHWQKEQMMKDAIEGKVVAVRNVMGDRLHTYPWIELETQLSKDDKIKAIIIKD